MQGNGKVVVHPEDILAAEIVAQRGHEAAGRGGALLRTNLGELSVTNIGWGVIPPGQTQKSSGCPAKSPLIIEDKDPGIYFVHNDERHAVIIARIDDPVGYASGVSGRMLALEVRPLRLSYYRGWFLNSRGGL